MYSHTGIYGNDRADELAKVGSKYVSRHLWKAGPVPLETKALIAGFFSDLPSELSKLMQESRQQRRPERFTVEESRTEDPVYTSSDYFIQKQFKVALGLINDQLSGDPEERKALKRKRFFYEQHYAQPSSDTNTPSSNQYNLHPTNPYKRPCSRVLTASVRASLEDLAFTRAQNGKRVFFFV